MLVGSRIRVYGSYRQSTAVKFCIMRVLNSDIGLWRDPLDNAGKSLEIDVAMGRYILGNGRDALPLSSIV